MGICVQMFKKGSCSDLNHDINNWLFNNDNITIIDTKLQVIQDPIFSSQINYICMIFYKRE